MRSSRRGPGRTAAVAVAGAVLGLAALAPGVAAADGVPIEPGLWEIRSTSKSPMMPAPQTHTRTECIRESELRPDFFEEPSSECRVLDSTVEGSRMRWTLHCTTEGGEMRGDGELVAEGERMHGSMTLTMEAQGQRMRFENAWEGRRLGPCE